MKKYNKSVKLAAAERIYSKRQIQYNLCWKNQSWQECPKEVVSVLKLIESAKQLAKVHEKEKPAAQKLKYEHEKLKSKIVQQKSEKAKTFSEHDAAT